MVFVVAVVLPLFGADSHCRQTLIIQYTMKTPTVYVSYPPPPKKSKQNKTNRNRRKKHTKKSIVQSN